LNEQDAGSNPVFPANREVAQLAEQRSLTAKVEGSTPSLPATFQPSRQVIQLRGKEFARPAESGQRMSGMTPDRRGGRRVMPFLRLDELDSHGMIAIERRRKWRKP
jgi:hypothetical protein